MLFFSPQILSSLPLALPFINHVSSCFINKRKGTRQELSTFLILNLLTNLHLYLYSCTEILFRYLSLRHITQLELWVLSPLVFPKVFYLQLFYLASPIDHSFPCKNKELLKILYFPYYISAHLHSKSSFKMYTYNLLISSNSISDFNSQCSQKLFLKNHHQSSHCQVQGA